MKVQVSIAQAIESLDDYYRCSFIATPSQCLPLLIALIGVFEGVLPQFSANKIQELNRELAVMADALHQKDYVLVRDILFYEIRPRLLKLTDSDSNKRKKGRAT